MIVNAQNAGALVVAGTDTPNAANVQAEVIAYVAPKLLGAGAPLVGDLGITGIGDALSRVATPSYVCWANSINSRARSAT